MITQTSAVVGHAEQSAKVAPHPAVMDMLGKSFARKYYTVMVIYAYLVVSQVDTCQPPTLTTY